MPFKLYRPEWHGVHNTLYWPEGPGDYWRELGTKLGSELARYQRVIWMQTCAAVGAYDGDRSNACRFEDAHAAVASGERLAELWSGHPRLVRIGAFPQLEDKVRAVIGVLEPALAAHAAACSRGAG